METSLFPDGVLVTSADLRNETTTKERQILLDRTTNLERGIMDGLVITVNQANAQRIDITSGKGMAPNGNYVELPVILAPNVGALNVPIADPSLGAVNLVCAFYTEVNQGPMPHETNGTSPMTRAVASFTVAVLTLAGFSALPASDPSFAQLAQDRALLIGKVTGTGGALLPSSIEQPVPWRSLNAASLLAPLLPGIELLAVSDSCPGGIGSIIFDATGPLTLAFQAPGEVSPGPAVTITAEGPVILTASGGSTIQVYVIFAALPPTSGNVGISVVKLYFQSVPRESAMDQHHRSMVGHGLPSTSNPHGLSIDDIAPGYVDELRNHQRFEHSTGIWAGSSPGCLGGTIIEASNPDTFTVTVPGGSDSFYVDGQRVVALTSTSITFGDAGVNRELYEIWVDSVGNIGKTRRATFPGGVPAFGGLETNVVSLNDKIPAGTYPVTYVSHGSGIGGTLQWGSGYPVPIPGFLPVQGALYRLHDGEQQVLFFLGDPLAITSLAAGTYVDNCVVTDSVDGLLKMLIAEISWDGNSNGGLGYTAQRGLITDPAHFIDRRRFGTLAAIDLRTEVLTEEVQLPIAEHSPDGVVTGELDNWKTGSLVVTDGGGQLIRILGAAPVYVRGKRHIVHGSTISIQNNVMQLIWVDELGAIQATPYADVAPFLMTPKTADVLSTVSPEVPLYGAALAIVNVVSGVIADIIDMRRQLSGGRVMIKPWSCGSHTAGRASAACEFFDLTAALIYADAASDPTSNRPTIELMEAEVVRQITIDAPTHIRGGFLQVGGAALATDAFLVKAPLTLEGVNVVMAPGAPNPGRSIFLLSSAGALDWTGGAYTAGFLSQVRALISTTTLPVRIKGISVDHTAASSPAAVVESTGVSNGIVMQNITSIGGWQAALVTGAACQATLEGVVGTSGDALIQGDASKSRLVGCRSGVLYTGIAAGSSLAISDCTFAGALDLPYAGSRVQRCTSATLTITASNQTIDSIVTGDASIANTADAVSIRDLRAATLIVAGTNHDVADVRCTGNVTLAGVGTSLRCCRASVMSISGISHTVEDVILDTVITIGDLGFSQFRRVRAGTNILGSSTVVITDIDFIDCTAGRIMLSHNATVLRKNIRFSGCTLTQIQLKQTTPTTNTENSSIIINNCWIDSVANQQPCINVDVGRDIKISNCTLRAAHTAVGTILFGDVVQSPDLFEGITVDTCRLEVVDVGLTYVPVTNWGFAAIQVITPDGSPGPATKQITDILVRDCSFMLYNPTNTPTPLIGLQLVCQGAITLVRMEDCTFDNRGVAMAPFDWDLTNVGANAVPQGARLCPLTGLPKAIQVGTAILLGRTLNYSHLINTIVYGETTDDVVYVNANDGTSFKATSFKAIGNHCRCTNPAGIINVPAGFITIGND
jgi:hypothetical protein